jgi:hypothetical protein
MITRFNELVVEQDTERSVLVKVRDSYEEAEEGRLRIEEQRVSLEKTHVEKEALSLKEERDVIDQAIASQTVDVSSARASYEERLLSVTAEIRDLEALLAVKRDEERQLQEVCFHAKYVD